MRKRLQLKWLIFGVFALGAITILPVVTTVCSGTNNDSDDTMGNNENESTSENTGELTGDDEKESTSENTGELTGDDEKESTTFPITNPATDYKYKYFEEDSHLMSFVGYGNEGSKDNMNAVVNKITPSINDITEDDISGIWKNSGVVLPDDYSYVRYTLIISDDFSSLENFISVTSWYNQTTNGLFDKFNPNHFNSAVLANWDVSLVLNVYTNSSYEFIFTIAPKETVTDEDTYQFILYTEENFDDKFPDGVPDGDDEEESDDSASLSSNLPIINPGTEYKYKEVSNNLISFMGYYGDEGSKNNMNAVVNKITPNINDITENDISGTWINSGIPPSSDSDNYSYARYSLIIDDDFSNLENFIGVTSWYNQITDSSLADKFNPNHFNYDALVDWDASLVLNVYTNSSYEFIFTIAPKNTDMTDIDTYQFVLYTKDDFAIRIPNGNRGEAGNYPVDNLKNYCIDSNNMMSFVGYYNESLGPKMVTENFNEIVSIITPSVSDIKNDNSGIWLKVLNDDGSYTYTLAKYNDGSEGVDTYQYAINFIDGNNTYLGWWKNLDSSNELSNELDSIDLDYSSLLNYDISLIITFYSETSYNFACTITSKDSGVNYKFILYTYYTYRGNYLDWDWE